MHYNEYLLTIFGVRVYPFFWLRNNAIKIPSIHLDPY